ncbi:NADH-quinone oxidoreductase subunit K [Candidatus Legionella polyplacis]|uniref:NADH-quinone oxidoreductase subunit NuoK n=1 Tax=Candidatus Legionella polyplacis TaxID=2005262 RepID=UPI000C1F64DD|nr:NADH-quinone oxidoreductase subunit NuoK [Candidatus Legionella polyplacis]ATW02079.1 NADH-quinone oxidoreductase subunit K [Candidatus Legionella polyplacis]
MLPIGYYLILTAVLFSFSLCGIVLRKTHMLVSLMCIELMFVTICTNFIIFSHFYKKIDGEIFVFFILAIAAAEISIGLSILMLYYRVYGNIYLDDLNKLKG